MCNKSGDFIAIIINDWMPCQLPVTHYRYHYFYFDNFIAFRLFSICGGQLMTTADLSFSFNSFELRCQFVSVMIHLALIHIQNPVSKTEFRVRDVATSSNSLIMLISEDQHNDEDMISRNSLTTQ